jgi:AbrB family looped-hinge helix DNA binding protein
MIESFGAEYYHLKSSNTTEQTMPTKLTVKGQVTIPKRVRDALDLASGDSVEFEVNESGSVVLSKATRARRPAKDRFEKARGSASVKWSTDSLMALLRSNS